MNAIEEKAKKYDKIVEIIHWYRSRLPEGDIGDDEVYGAIMSPVFRVVKDDVLKIANSSLGGDSAMS